MFIEHGTYKFSISLINQIPGLSLDVLLHPGCKSCKPMQKGDVTIEIHNSILIVRY